MPPVYAAFFMWVASAVLWWSGWREETADGIPDRFVAVFLAGWPIAASTNTVFGQLAVVNGAFAWTGLAMIALAWPMERVDGITACSAGILCGSLAILLSRSPWLWSMSGEWMSQVGSALAAGVVAAMLAKGAAGQLIAVTTALTLLEGFEAAITAEDVIGSPVWMQSWWISALSARLWSMLAGAVKRRVVRPVWEPGDEGS